MSELEVSTEKETKKSRLQRIWNLLTEPSKRITDRAEQRAARLAASFLLAITLIAIVGGFARISTHESVIEAFTGPIGYTLIVLLITYYLARTRWYRAAIFLFSLSFSAQAYISMINQGGAADNGLLIFVYVPISLIVASTFISAPAVFLLIALNIGAYFSIQAFGITLPENIWPQIGITTVIGVVLVLLNNFRRATERLNLEELQTANRELEQLSTGLEQRVAERTKALETSLKESTLLSEISQNLARVHGDISAVARTVAETFVNLDIAPECSISQLQPDNETLVVISDFTRDVETGELRWDVYLGEETILPDFPATVKVMSSLEPLQVTKSDPDADPAELAYMEEFESATLMILPLAVGGQAFGLVELEYEAEEVRFSQEEMDLAMTLANQGAIALQNAHLFEQTREATERFELAVSGSNDGIWDWNILTNEVYYSPRLKEMVGYSEEEFGNAFAEFEEKLHPEDHDRVMQTVNDYLEGKISVYEPEFRFRHKDGSYRWILSRGTVIRNEEGVPVRMAGSHTDTTESRMQFEQTQRQADHETKLNTITQKIQGADTIEEAMQVAVRELGQALGKRQTFVTLDPAVMVSEGKDN